MLLPTMFSNKLFWSLFASVLIKVLTSLLLGFSHLRGHKFNHNFSDCLDQIYVCGKLFISSSNIPYFLKKGKSSWIKFVILTVHLLIKMKTLSVIHIFLVKRTWTHYSYNSKWLNTFWVNIPFWIFLFILMYHFR